MPDIARWNGIDQLAESYLSTSTYAYVANNPISNTDPDGRWIYENGSIGQGPATWDMAGPKYKPYLMMQNYGMSTNYAGNEGGGGGGGTLTIGNITGAAFGFLQDFFLNGNSVNALFSMIDQLKAIGFKDPSNTSTTFGDWEKIIKADSISELISVLNNAEGSNNVTPDFRETTNFLFKGKSDGFQILINMKNISSVLEYAFIIGHELNHSIFGYFRDDFYKTINSNPNNGTSRSAFGFFNEYNSYNWEMKMGNKEYKSAWDITYRRHGPDSKYSYHSQISIDLVQQNLNSLNKAWIRFYNKNLKK